MSATDKTEAPDRCVSVVIPTSGDRLPMLERAIQSIAPSAQYVKEILVVDDHNNDSILRRQVSELVATLVFPVPLKLCTTDGRVGASMARNIGVASAEGEYICFLDDDDEMLADGIGKRLELIRRIDADFVVGDFLRSSQAYRKRYARVRLGNLSEYLVSGYCQTPSIMVHARVRERVMFPIVPKFQDYLYVLQLLLADFSGHHFPQPVYVQHLDAGQRMAHNDNKLEAWQQRVAIERTALDRVAPAIERQMRFRWRMELVKAGLHHSDVKSLTWLLVEITQLKNRRNIILYSKAFLSVLLPVRFLRSLQAHIGKQS